MKTNTINPLLLTDVYKLGHMVQYKPGTQRVFSHLVARSKKTFRVAVFFGLQYIIEKYLSIPLEQWMADEFFETYRDVLGIEPSDDVKQKINSLIELGHWPLDIRAVPEGTVVDNGNVLMTIENTIDGFHWCVGFVESLLLKVWYPTTVATCCLHYRMTVEEFYNKSVDATSHWLKLYAVHDFGYRGDTSEESAMISGAAHLLSFTGSDTIVAKKFINDYFLPSNPKENFMSSVPASEHSVMCSYGREDEINAFRHMLATYPTGIVSIVSDTYDVYNVVTSIAKQLYDDIVSRDGKVVFRPDSGDPKYVLCGCIQSINHHFKYTTEEYQDKHLKNYEDGDILYSTFDSEYYLVKIQDGKKIAVSYEPTNEEKGLLRLLDELFGSTYNERGYKVLNPKVGLIYGDGMYLQRYRDILHTMQQMGYSVQNLVVGVGGLLRYHSRDTLGFAIKATEVHIDGEVVDIWKDPITDPGKRSFRGRVGLVAQEPSEYEGRENIEDVMTYTTVNMDKEQFDSKENILQPVFLNGQLQRRHPFDEVRNRVDEYIVGYYDRITEDDDLSFNSADVMKYVGAYLTSFMKLPVQSLKPMDGPSPVIHYPNFKKS